MTAARQGSSADPAALMRMDAATGDLIKFLVTRAFFVPYTAAMRASSAFAETEPCMGRAVVTGDGAASA